MSEIIILIYIFVLSIFVGFELITKVPPTLHTPLMSGSNAISGVTILGAIVASGSGGWNEFSSLLGFIGIILATINVFGGYVVTDRMLNMFRKKERTKDASSKKNKKKKG